MSEALFFGILVGCLHYYKCRHLRHFFGGLPFKPNIFSFDLPPPSPPQIPRAPLPDKKRTLRYLCVSVFNTKVLIEDTIFMSPTAVGSAILRCTPSYKKVWPFTRQSQYLHFSVFYQEPENWSVSEIEPATTRSGAE